MFPFPSLGVRDDGKEKALRGNEGVEVPTMSIFYILWYLKDWLLFPLQNVDKLLLDLQDDESFYEGLKEAHGYVNLKVNNIRL